MPALSNFWAEGKKGVNVCTGGQSGWGGQEGTNDPVEKGDQDSRGDGESDPSAFRGQAAGGGTQGNAN